MEVQTLFSPKSRLVNPFLGTNLETACTTPTTITISKGRQTPLQTTRSEISI